MSGYGKLSIIAVLLLVGVPVSLNTLAGTKSAQEHLAHLSLPRKILLGGECWGRSDYPHISTHVPRTVNVVAETACPGGAVSVRTTLSRPGWFIFRQSVTSIKTGINSVRTNVALQCRWRRGDSPIEYVVKSEHRDDTGAIGFTELHKALKC